MIRYIGKITSVIAKNRKTFFTETHDMVRELNLEEVMFLVI